jgi:hypothetical protein
MKDKKLVCGVGISDAGYVVKVTEEVGYIEGKRKRKTVWVCPFYRAWTNMLMRAYSDEYKARQPTYEGVTVCEEWHTFSIFKAWMETQDWEGKQLDKDILFSGNKVYAPEACVFVSSLVNKFLVSRAAARGLYKIGVHWVESKRKFKAECSNPLSEKGDHIGMFLTEQEAHEAWLAKKLEYAHALAATQTDERVAKALIDRYENYISN